MNFNALLPHNAVSPVMLLDETTAEYPFFSGTGFWAKWHSSENVFFITAKHCIQKDGVERSEVDLIVKLHNDGICTQDVPIKTKIMGKFSDDDFFEDVVVFDVDIKKMNIDDQKILRNKAILLPHPRLSTYLIDGHVKGKQKIRITGYPTNGKDVDYDRKEARAQARGVVGTVSEYASNLNVITVKDINWREGELGGFSGSPVFAVVPNNSEILIITIGIVLQGNSEQFNFMPIDVATNIIEAYLVNHN